MVSLQKVYSGNALTRQVKRISQDIKKQRLCNATKIVVQSGIGGGAVAGILKLADAAISPISIIAGALMGSLYYHYKIDTLGRDFVKSSVNYLKYLKSTDEYQNILARAKAIKNAK